MAKESSGANASSNALVWLAFVAVIVAVIGLFVTYNNYNFSRALLSPTGQGDVNLSIASETHIVFNVTAIKWGSGSIPPVVGTYENLTSNSTSALSVPGGFWDRSQIADGADGKVGQGLLLENTGNTDVSLTLTSGRLASDPLFLGGTNPVQQWYLVENMTGSCLGPNRVGTYWTGWTTVAVTTPITVCNRFEREAGSDRIMIHVNLVVPWDAPAGPKLNTITATATGTIPP